MTRADFVHLHAHSHYSLLDAPFTVAQLVKVAAKMKMPALALTDHGAMYGIVEFCAKASKEGIKPIVGCEVYVTEGSRHDRTPHHPMHHLTLLARNAKGYQNLCRLVSLGFTEGFYFKPRVDDELLAECAEGLIALSGCIWSRINQYLLAGRQEDAVAATRRYREMFGEECFFLELCDHALDRERIVMPQVVQLGKDLSIPLVLTNDCHYLERGDAEAQDHLICITTGRVLDDDRRPRFETSEYYFKSPEEMRGLFPEQPEAYANTVKIASMCNVDPTSKEKHLPRFEVPGGKTATAYLRDLCEEALPRRYEVVTEDIRKRLDFELSVIDKMGFSAYFLIVWDFIDHARSKGIPVGPGRGSAAGAIVAYLLGITAIDPLRYNLVFERFLNPERVSMPDIDIDFDFERRGEVVEYVVQRYGRDNVSKIITFNLLKAKAALKDVARVRGLDFTLSNKITKAVPEELNITLAKALETSAELRAFSAQDERLGKLFEVAQKLEGMARNSSIHAAGVVIAPEQIWKFAPLAKNKDDLATQFDMKSLDEIGLLKMDFLGLKTLTVIQNALAAIKKRRKVELDISKIPSDDKRTYRLLCARDTIGVFQFESTGFKELLKRLKPSVFEDLIAVIALYRPGPLGSGMVDDFIDGKHGKKKVVYPHPSLAGILKETYGVMLYQEQVMQCSSILAGYSLGEADQLRRAMGKKKAEEMERHRSRFIKGASERGTDEATADGIFNLMQKFADYGFNKSHSAAYALISYQTAYLKANFPQEVMAANLTNDRDDTDRIAILIEECRRMGISILPPDVNESETDFTVVGKSIRFGLSAIKGIGDSAVDAILQARSRHGPFPNLETFCRRVDSRAVNRRILESLIKCGAFATFPQNRAQLLSAVDLALNLGQDSQRNESIGQMTLADLMGGGTAGAPGVGMIEYPKIPEFERRALLNFERETLGLYLSGHPLGAHQRLLDRVAGLIPTLDVMRTPEDTTFAVAGMIKSLRKVRAKASGKDMAVIVLEDTRGSLELPFFAERYEESKGCLKEDAVVVVWGSVQERNGERRASAEGAMPLESLFGERGWKAEVALQLPAGGLTKGDATRMKNIFLNHRGRHQVDVSVLVLDHRVVIRLGKDFKVNPNAEFISELDEMLGEGCVSIRVALPERPPPRFPPRNGFSGQRGTP